MISTGRRASRADVGFVLMLVGITALLPSCRTGAAQPSQLQVEGDVQPFGAGLPSTVAKQPYSFGSIPLCLQSSRGPIDIRAVSLVDPAGGLVVSAWATRTTTGPPLGSAPLPLDKLGFTPESGRVALTCQAAESGEHGKTELALEFRKPSQADARGIGIRIRYTAVGKHSTATRVLDIPFHVRLCVKAGACPAL